MAVAPAPEVRKGLPIVAYLVFGVSALMIASIGGVLLITLSVATRNTFELLEDKSRLLITGIAQQVRLFPRAGGGPGRGAGDTDRERPARSCGPAAAVRCAAGRARRHPPSPLGGVP